MVRNFNIELCFYLCIKNFVQNNLNEAIKLKNYEKNLVF